MKHTSKLMLIALALGSSAWIATAQTTDAPPGGPGMRPHRQPPAFLKALDANADGVIDADEIANAAAALTALDKNGDGNLTPEELFGPRPEGQAPADGQKARRPQGPPPGAGMGGSANRPPAPPVIAELDADHDGVVTAEELSAASDALKKLDKNADGKLSPDEFLAPRRRGPGGHGGPGMAGPGGFGRPPQDSAQEQ